FESDWLLRNVAGRRRLRQLRRSDRVSATPVDARPPGRRCIRPILGPLRVAVESDCPQRARAAGRLGAERRRLFLVSALLSVAAPLLPYRTGAWETIWFSLASLPLPFGVRAIAFLLGFHAMMAVVMLPLSYYGGFVLPRVFDLGRQSRRAWAVDWLK